MEQNDEHQDEGFCWHLSLVSRQSYISFILSIEPLVVISLTCIGLGKRLLASRNILAVTNTFPIKPCYISTD